MFVVSRFGLLRFERYYWHFHVGNFIMYTRMIMLYMCVTFCYNSRYIRLARKCEVYILIPCISITLSQLSCVGTSRHDRAIYILTIYNSFLKGLIYNSFFCIQYETIMIKTANDIVSEFSFSFFNQLLPSCGSPCMFR